MRIFAFSVTPPPSWNGNGRNCRATSPQEQLKQLATGIAGELDLMSEGTNCELLASIFPDSPDIVFPKIYWERTSDQVLVQEYIDGIPPTDKARVREAGLDPAALAQTITNAFLNMALVEGVFHADPHPGKPPRAARQPDRVHRFRARRVV
jgi:predicted unusual protein kinase regulating ubiquinone biosynthesis (AarF/ABC1/UbiB family)